MCRILLSTIAFLFCSGLSAQTFNGTGGQIPDGPAPETCFPLTVSGVGPINTTTHGLYSICLNITHKFDSDLEMKLKAPDGTTILLSSRIGGGGDNYTNTCFTGTATSSIATGTAPFTGTFRPLEVLGRVNNGQNADGVWSLCIRDYQRTDSGQLVSWSLLFNGSPAPPPPPPPSNDEACGALSLPVSSACSYSYFTTDGATNSASVPAPICGFYRGGDVWFQVTVPTSGIIQIDTKEGTLTDAAMALYTSLCDDPTYLTNKCDDNSSANGNMPSLSASGLTPRSIVWIRVWGRGNFNGTFLSGTFGICVTTPPAMPACTGNPAAGNTCATATPVCNLTGWCGNTSTAYTTDAWPQLTAAFCGGLQNDSYIKFIATDTVASFYVWVTSTTFTGTNGGIQMMIYDGGCGSGNVTSHGCYYHIPPSNGVPTLITGTKLTVGGTYYLLIDGYNRDNCNYVISANTGTVLNVTPVNAASPNICQGQKVTLKAKGGNNVYSWSPAAGLNQTTGSTVIASPDTTTTYTITSAAPAGCSGTVSTTVTVTVTPAPALGADKSATICSGSYADLNSYFNVTGVGVQWLKGGIPVLRPDSVTTAGLYTLIATNSGGCKDTATINITIVNRLALGADRSVLICSGGTANLTTMYNTSGLMTNWTSGGTPVPNPSSVGVGIYQLIVNDGVSCPDTALVTVTVASGVPGPPQPVSICPSALPYVWNGKAYNASGTYYDTLVSMYGCDSIVTLALTVKPNSSSTTTVNKCPAQLPFSWNGTSYTNSGTYTLKLVNAAGCDSTATLIFTVTPNSTSTTNVEICEDQVPYTWNGSSYSASGAYTKNFTNAAGCDSSAVLILWVRTIPPTPLAVSNSPVCSGANLHLQASLIANGAYTWTGPNGFLSYLQNPEKDDLTTANAGNYIVTVKVNGCQSPPDTAAVVVIQSPVVNAGPDKQIREGDTAYINPIVVGRNLTYLWSPADYLLTPDTLKNIAVLGVRDITYYLIARDTLCPSKADDISITVLPRIKPMSFPNSFSPNGDGIHDVWMLRDLAAYPKARVDVFNRYGEVVYKNLGADNPWDGTFKGKPVPIGTYYYIIFVNDKIGYLNGNVTLIR